MNLEKWDKSSIINYHKQPERSYAGDVLSPEIIRLSKKYIGNSILDVGAGSGALISLIPNAIGVDLVSKHPRIIRGDISTISFKDQCFDTVFATEVLEHLNDETLEKCLDEIHRILQTDGCLIITVPNNEDLKKNMVMCPRCGSKFHRVGHMQIFDVNRMRDMLEKKRFEIVRIECLSIGFMAKHKSLKHFKYFLELIGYIESNSLFAVAIKR